MLMQIYAGSGGFQKACLVGTAQSVNSDDMFA